MPGSITLPQVVLDLEEEDRRRYAQLEAPKSIVVRYGALKLIAELPYSGDAKPGCGSKLVVRTHRGTELAEMLTTTCGNGGCGKSVSRKQMLEYIDNSGGRDYPFSNQGRVLRVATIEDLNRQSALDGGKMPLIRTARAAATEMNLPMRVVDVEQLLGGERIIFHYTSENWVDFRELVRRLASELHARIEMHQVSARDEARLVADYEKCGQQCCCKQFLKVLKPVSMRSAKVQKATLDPTKISGRCGRLMCCLRYEDETYESLRKKLPKKLQRVKTADGEGFVLDSQILTQLVLVRLDRVDMAPAAYPLENIEILIGKFQPQQRPEDRPPQGDRRGGPGRPQGRAGAPGPGGAKPERRGEPRRPKPGEPLADDEVESREGDEPVDPTPTDQGAGNVGGEARDNAPSAPQAPSNPRPPQPNNKPATPDNTGGKPGANQAGGQADGRRRRGGPYRSHRQQGGGDNPAQGNTNPGAPGSPPGSPPGNAPGNTPPPPSGPDNAPDSRGS